MARKRTRFDSFLNFIKEVGFVIDEGKTEGIYADYYEGGSNDAMVVAYFPGSLIPQVEFSLTEDRHNLDVMLVETYDEREEVVDVRFTALSLFEKECAMVASKFDATVSLNFRDYQGDFNMGGVKGSKKDGGRKPKNTRNLKAKDDKQKQKPLVVLAIKILRELRELEHTKLLKDEISAVEFLEFVEEGEYACSPWCSDDVLAASEWVLEGGFGECGEPEWFSTLDNVKRGATNSIDNCTGEFENFHLAIAAFLTKKTRKQVDLIADPWLETSDEGYNSGSLIRFSIKNDKEQRIVSITRGESTESRKSIESLDIFIKTLFSIVIDNFEVKLNE